MMDRSINSDESVKHGLKDTTKNTMLMNSIVKNTLFIYSIKRCFKIR